LAIFGFLFAVLAGSLGGHMAGLGSVLDPVYSLFGIDPLKFGLTGNSYIVVLIIGSLVAVVVPLVVFYVFQKRAKIMPEKPSSQN
jgi:phosphotransferase system  glucose/maltose/N-acetylglucosamine-specific IIC component